MLRTHGRRQVLALALAAALLAPAACSSQDSGQRTSVGDVIRNAVEKARESRQDGSGDTSSQPTSTSTIGTDGRSAFDYASYQQTLASTLSLLEEYWRTTLPELGGRYRPLHGYTYYRSDQGGGPTCGGEPAPPNNAFYCPAGDFIAWDETGLMIPYYVQGGVFMGGEWGGLITPYWGGGGFFAASFFLAHEFGHAMQARLPRQET